MMKRQISVCLGFFVVLLLCFNASADTKSYTVKKGDNLYTISKQLGVSVNEIKKINNLTSNKLKLGQILNVTQGAPASAGAVKSKSRPQTVTSENKVDKAKPKPYATSSYTVKKGDTFAVISKKTGVPMKQIAALNKASSRKLRIGQTIILSKSSQSPQGVVNEDEDLLEDDDEEISSSDTPNDLAFDAKSSDELLGKWGSPDERKLFIKVATGFLGAPYRLGGATVRGIDCSGFVRKMYELFDISLPRTAHEQSSIGVRIERDKLVEGDLVFFRTRKPIGHVGIYIGNNEFLHASYKSRAVRIDNLDMPYFNKRFQRAVRVKGLVDNDGT